MALDTYTKLLLHTDGTDESTTFVDSSPSGHTCTAMDSATISTDQSKFGNASGFFPDWAAIKVADSDDWDFGTGSFTVDFWVRFLVDQPATFFWRYINFERYVVIDYISGTTLRFLDYPVGYAHEVTAPWAPSVDTWYHVALVRNGTGAGCFKFYVDGTYVTSTYGRGTESLAVTDYTDLYIGYRYILNINQLNGYLDEYRISKGIARWTSNFTPPTRAYGTNTPQIQIF